MAQAMTTLAYGGIMFEDGYKAAGQFSYLQSSVKWGTDYFIKAHVSPNEFYCQVGNGDIDHAYPGTHFVNGTSINCKCIKFCRKTRDNDSKQTSLQVGPK